MKTQTSTTDVRRVRRGFTLIEIIIVIMVIGVAAGLIVPRMGRSVEREELDDAANRLAYTARTVRDLAVSMQCICAVEIDLDEGAYGTLIQSETSSEDSDGLEAVEASWLQMIRLPASVRIAPVEAADGTITSTGTVKILFEPDGTSSGARLRLMTENREAVIVIHEHTGRVDCADNEAEIPPRDYIDLGD